MASFLFYREYWEPRALHAYPQQIPVSEGQKCAEKTANRTQDGELIFHIFGVVKAQRKYFLILAVRQRGYNWQLFGILW
jgi:hypothetical protein